MRIHNIKIKSIIIRIINKLVMQEQGSQEITLSVCEIFSHSRPYLLRVQFVQTKQEPSHARRHGH